MSFHVVVPPEVSKSDPDWSIKWGGFDSLRERDLESLMTVGNGYLGTRGSLEEPSSASRPLTLIAGLFNAIPEAGDMPRLAAAPDWLCLRIRVDGEELSVDSGQNIEHNRTLDLKRGLLLREWRHQDGRGRITRYRSMRFASMADRHVVGMRICITPENYTARLTVESGIDGDVANTGGMTGADHWKYLEPVTSGPIESGGVVFAMRTRGHRPNISPIAVALASRTTVSVEIGQGEATNIPGDHISSDADAPNQAGPDFHHRSIFNSLFATEVTEWDAAIGQSYIIDKIVTVWTSRDDDANESAQPDNGPAAADGRRPRVVTTTFKGAQKDSSKQFQTDPRERAIQHLTQQSETGIDRLISASGEEWARRWTDAEIDIEGDRDTQRAIRFAIYHLIIAADPNDEHVSISPRTLTGEVYNGHVFWDTETFMLPFFTFTHPPSARSLLMYRYWTLPGARAKARANGYKGAMYAWESADTGLETTPTEVPLPTGGVVKVLSGIEEQHISADIPYAVWQYWQATGDDRFMADFGAEIIFECARFWASRLTLGQDGKCHILKVIGPDEYHEDVNDNAFTNVMAAWTMETASSLAGWMKNSHQAAMLDLESRIGLNAREPEQWKELSAKMYTGLDAKTGLFEQFAGFSKLDQIDLASYEPRTAPMDILLGHDRIQQVQVVKQADVLMLFQLLPDRYSSEIVRKNYEYYEPRTAHGSSLSPATHALIAARLGLTDAARRFFAMGANIDLGNGLGNTFGGVHGATCGGLWQAIVMGFAGVELTEDGIRIDPKFPRVWGRVAISLIYRSRHLRIAVEPEPSTVSVTLEDGADPLDIRIGSTRARVGTGQLATARLIDGKWTIDPRGALDS